MLTFNEHGHLAPPGIHELSLPEFEAIFVDGMPDPAHRRALFEDYLRFVLAVRATFKVPFYQWVAGSFITTKEFPGDIDTVTFLPHETMIRNLQPLHLLKTAAKTDFQVDASFCPVCKWNHRFFEENKKKEEYFRDLYGHARPDFFNRRMPKGIVKLTFTP